MEAVSVEVRGFIAASAEELLEIIGPFAEMHTWHPAVSSCVGDAARRTLETPGGRVVEAHVETTPKGIVYTVEEAPYPIDNARCRLRIEAAAGGSDITWTMQAEVPGELRDAIQTGFGMFYQAGIDALAVRALKE